MKKLFNKRRNKIIICIFFVICFCILGTNPHNAYATNQRTYTREELQKIVVSTALNYYYNGYYSDYFGKTGDILGIFQRRNLSITPEKVGRDNFYYSSCGSMSSIVYRNTIGYDMSEYYEKSTRNYIYLNDQNEAAYTRVNEFGNPYAFKDLVDYHGRFGDAGIFGEIAEEIIADNNKKMNTCFKAVDSSGNKLNDGCKSYFKDENPHELVYYYRPPESEIQSGNAERMKQVLEQNLDGYLEPGDIIYFEYVKNPNGATIDDDGFIDTGDNHVMLYLGNVGLRDKEGNLSDSIMHITNSSETGKLKSDTSNHGIYIGKAKGTQADAIEQIKDICDARHFISLFVVYRPLNNVCTYESNGEEVCKIGGKPNAWTNEVTDQMMDNNEARTVFNDTRIEQYQSVSKRYTYDNYVDSNKNPATRTINNIVREQNSVNVGDEIKYNLYLNNDTGLRYGTVPSERNISITAPIPSGATFSSCNNSCTHTSSTVTWTNVNLTNKTYAYTVKVNDNYTGKFVTNNGFNLKCTNCYNNKDSSMQMDEMTIAVNPTFNGSNIRSLKKWIENNPQDLEEDVFAYVRRLYKDNYNLTLPFENKTTSSAFKQIREDLMPTISGIPDEVFDGKTSEKTAFYFSGLRTNSYSNMMVKGLYGGRRVVGNLTKDRVDFIRAFGAYNYTINKQSFTLTGDKYLVSDLQIGDIILGYRDASHTFTYLVNDVSNSGIKLYGIDYTEEGTTPQLMSEDTSDANLLYMYDHFRWFIVIRPSKIGTTVFLKRDGTDDSNKLIESYVVFDTYEKLPDFNEKIYHTVTFNSSLDSNVDGTELESERKYGWYKDEQYTQMVSNGTVVSDKENHYLYGKEYYSNVKLPDSSVIGYNLEGWYKDNTFTTKVGNAGDSYTPEDNITLYAKYSAESYKVTYILDGGTNNSNNKSSYNYNESIVLENPTKSGYIFGGWYSDSDLTENFAFTKMPANNITVYAKWINSGRTVTYNLDGGTNDTSNPFAVKVGDSITLNSPTKEGNNFVGWKLADGQIVSKISNYQVTDDNSLSFTAIWSIKSYSITYNLDGGINNTSNKASYNYNEELIIHNPSKTGYTFNGWYIDSTKTKKLTNSFMPANDLVLYAKWSINNYSVKFIDRDNEYIEYFDYNQNIIFENTLNNTGHTFDGWYTDISYTNKYTLGKMPANDLMLYAKWNKNTYTTTFNFNISGISSYIVNADYNSIVYEPEIPQNKGYVFNGWYSDILLTNYYTLSENGNGKYLTIPNGNITLYAKWVKEKHKVTFDTNGGNQIDSSYYEDGEKILLPIQPSKEGYAFGGWFLDEGLTIDASNAIMPNHDVILYAKWVEGFSISYELNGGANNSGNPFYYQVGNTINLNNPTRKGAKFLGWYLEEDFINEKEAINSSDTGNIVLYAKWELINYTISFETNGGQPINSFIGTYGQKIDFSLDLTKEHYSFGGWFLDRELKNEVNFDEIGEYIYYITGNDTLYAKWNINSYILSFETNGGDTINSIEIPYDNVINLPKNPTREGYSFDGWYTNETLTNKFNLLKMPGNDIKLYAKWSSEEGVLPVYRMYNKFTGEHLYTTDANEKEVLYKEHSWGYEGIGWYTTNSGEPIYRLYNPGLGNHLYTSDEHEVEVLTTTYGWRKDNDGLPVMYSSGTIPVYRVYNKDLHGMHHLTTNKKEYNKLPEFNWVQEGISMLVYEIGEPLPKTEYYNN